MLPQTGFKDILVLKLFIQNLIDFY